MTDIQEQTATTAGDQEAGHSEVPVLDADSLNADQQIALALLEEICVAAGDGAHVVARSAQPPYLHLELLGEGIRQTFGKSGPGLDSLQFLCNLIVSRRVSTDVRIMLDAEGYRERRADSLRQFAVELAGEVKARNEEAEMQPLPAHERRIVHNALMDDPDITTYSEGEEPARRIVIAPRR